jgi:hypothetical protein
MPFLRQPRRDPDKEVGRREGARLLLAGPGSVGPISGQRICERHRATLKLAGNTAVCLEFCEMEAGIEPRQCEQRPQDH